jgi:hypothetical protein
MHICLVVWPLSLKSEVRSAFAITALNTKWNNVRIRTNVHVQIKQACSNKCDWWNDRSIPRLAHQDLSVVEKAKKLESLSSIWLGLEYNQWAQILLGNFSKSMAIGHWVEGFSRSAQTVQCSEADWSLVRWDVKRNRTMSTACSPLIALDFQSLIGVRQKLQNPDRRLSGRTQTQFRPLQWFCRLFNQLVDWLIFNVSGTLISCRPCIEYYAYSAESRDDDSNSFFLVSSNWTMPQGCRSMCDSPYIWGSRQFLMPSIRRNYRSGAVNRIFVGRALGKSDLHHGVTSIL